HLEGERHLVVALAGLDPPPLGPLVGLTRRLRLEVRPPLRLPDGCAYRVDAEELRRDLRQGPEEPCLPVTLLQTPEARERGLSREDPEVVGQVLLVNIP